MKAAKITLLAGLAMLMLVGASLAQMELTITDGREGEDLAAQGWTQVEEGLWERTALDGRKEKFVSGIAGLEKVLPSLREQLGSLMDAYLNHPTAANKRALDQQSQLISAVESNIGSARGKNPAGVKAAATACTRTFTYGANTSYHHCLDVAASNASYSTSNPTACPQQCTVYSYAYVSKYCGGVQTQDSQSCTQTGTNVSCSSFVENYAGTNCYHYAYASIHCPLLNNLYLSQSDFATTCVCSC
jgi:hypothetical protein